MMDAIEFEGFDRIEEFDEIIDVRSPTEFAEDHIPGAINLPVLDDAERIEVGTLHREAGEFEARKRGAALVSLNISRHLERHFAGRPKSYRPLVYCWRGGQRSRSLATVLEAVGWRTSIVQGGYKSYRRFVRESLEKTCSRLHPVILTGLTGAGKTKILRHMMETGARQVLDLEGLANHRGSLLGDEVGNDGARQPSQKRFESLLLHALRKIESDRPVLIESESKRIGALSIPESLWSKMIAAPVIMITVPVSERARFLVHEYRHFVEEPETLLAKLPVLKRMHGAQVVADWESLVRQGDWIPLAESLLECHYDPSYIRCKNYREPALHLSIPLLDAEGIAVAASQIDGFCSELDPKPHPPRPNPPPNPRPNQNGASETPTSQIAGLPVDTV